MMEAKREMQMQVFDDWLEMWDLKTQCSDSTMRKLTQGKIKDIFLDFFAKNTRPDEWIQNSRDNLYVKDHAERLEERRNERKKQADIHSARMDKMQRELDELTRKEESLRAGVLSKRQLFQSSARKSNQHVKLSKLDEQLMKGLKLEYLEKVERKSRPFLEKLETLEGKQAEIVPSLTHKVDGESEGESESERLDSLQEEVCSVVVSIGSQRMSQLATHPHHLHQKLEVKNGGLVEEKMKEMKSSGMNQHTVHNWLRENRVQDIQRIHLQSRHMGKTDLHGVHRLEQILESRVSGWSLVYLELRKENHLSQSYIAHHPIRKFLESKNELTRLVIGNEVLKAELKFYEGLSPERDPLLRELVGRVGKSPMRSNAHPQLTLRLPQHTLVDKERIEDTLVALMKSWPSVKDQVRTTQAVREELYSNKLPRVQGSWTQVLNCILNHMHMDGHEAQE